MVIGKPPKVLKIGVSEESILLRTEESVQAESISHGEEILRRAKKDAEKIRRNALEAAERERQTAREEAARVLWDAEENKQALIDEASEKSREATRQEVLEEFRPRIEEGVERFEKVIREAEEAWRGCLDKHKNEVVALALGIAERIVHKISEEDHELVRRTAEEALSRARERQKVILRVHPEDTEVLEEFEEELLARFEDIRTFRVESDRRVDRGGVWIETESGFIDARIGNQLDEIMGSILPTEERPETEDEGE